MNDLLFEDILAEAVTANARKPRKIERPVQPPRPDPVADALVQNGLAPNAFLLDLNRALTVPRDMEFAYPWNLPSRLFQFPIEISGQQQDGTRNMGLRHPLLTDHPFVKHVETALGVELSCGDEANGYGARWHAVDLISAGRWRDLLEARRFTTPENIAGAVAFGLQYSPQEGKKRSGHISTAEAREIMAAINSPEPTGRDSIIREHFMPPSMTKSEKGAERWPINNMARDEYAEAWGNILGIEAGWFAHDRTGFLGWMKAGRDHFPDMRREERQPAAKPEPPTEASKPKPTLADEIGPRPGGKSGTQLDLF